MRQLARFLLRTWRYLSCSADGVSAITSEASRRARLAFCSPPAAITCKKEITRVQQGRYLKGSPFSPA